MSKWSSCLQTQTRQFLTRPSTLRKKTNKSQYLTQKRASSTQQRISSIFTQIFLKRHFSDIPWATVQRFPWLQLAYKSNQCQCTGQLSGPAQFAPEQRGFGITPALLWTQLAPTPPAFLSINHKHWLMSRNLKAGIRSQQSKTPVFSGYLYWCNRDKWIL